MVKTDSTLMSRVFEIFSELCSIPHGSGNMDAIASFVENFAKRQGLRVIRDAANNVIIFKPATKGYENAEPIILQGHLDMVCQAKADCPIDFETQGLEIYIEGDFIKAKDTSLGADNGIAVAYVLAILESDEVSHPAIEAVFTSDEEIGMIGAGKLDVLELSAKKMINLDSEEDDTLTVSCAGGSEFVSRFVGEKVTTSGNTVTVILEGLKGGHSGVEIHKGRTNSNILAGRFLNTLKNEEFSLHSINGGDKSNAITNRTIIVLASSNADALKSAAEKALEGIASDVLKTEPDFCYSVAISKSENVEVFSAEFKTKIIEFLLNTPNGVLKMSDDVQGLVETSLNLGILVTEEDSVRAQFSLRSNKSASLFELEKDLGDFCKTLEGEIEAYGHYPPWEFKKDSKLQELYKQCYEERNGQKSKVEAIHAGLECGVFAAKIKDLDCIAMGPSLFDVHTYNEKLSISSAVKTFFLLLDILKKSN